MKYFKRDKKICSKKNEITREEAYLILSTNWDDSMDLLNNIFTHETAFRLRTPCSIIWTQDEDGKIPMPGFYGIILTV